MKTFFVLFLITASLSISCGCTEKEGTLIIIGQVNGIADDEILINDIRGNTVNYHVINISQYKTQLEKYMRDRTTIQIFFHIKQDAAGYQSFTIQEIK
jgi:hypothetical protein